MADLSTTREHSVIRTDEPLVDEWRDLLTRHSAVSCALEKALQDQHGIGVSEFETLDLLVDAGAESYRMSELAKDIYLSQSALSRTVARLERDKLVDRTMCTSDRRSIYVCLTESGRDLHARARATHRDVLATKLR
ncbi:MAG: MarR family transcriptional regulator [Rhodococcus fascians]